MRHQPSRTLQRYCRQPLGRERQGALLRGHADPEQPFARHAVGDPLLARPSWRCAAVVGLATRPGLAAPTVFAVRGSRQRDDQQDLTHPKTVTAKRLKKQIRRMDISMRRADLRPLAATRLFDALVKKTRLRGSPLWTHRLCLASSASR